MTTTIHANSATQAITRLTSCVLQSGIELPFQAIRSSIADSIHLLVHIERRDGRRFVSQLFEVEGYDPALDRFQFQSHFDAANEFAESQRCRLELTE